MLVTELQVGGYTFGQPTHYGAKYQLQSQMQLPLQNQDQYEKGFLQFRTPYPSGFGSLSGQPHLGSDILTPVGVPLYAVADGTISFSWGTQGGNTATLICQNPFKELDCDVLRVRYMHLFRFEGQNRQVKQGELIGYTGNTGASTAPHLHIDFSKNGSSLNIRNFYDPNIIFYDLIPKYMNLSDWELQARNYAMERGYSNGERPRDTLKRIEMMEMLRKYDEINKPADLKVHTFILNDFNTNEQRAYNLAIRDTNRFFDGYANLIFEKPIRSNLSLEYRLNRLQGFNPKNGLNVVIAPLADVQRMRGGSFNGFMILNQRTTVIGRELLLREDTRGRSNVNHYSATLIHELMHWFGARLDSTNVDRTHDFDFNYTLSNYLPKLDWYRLNNDTFRTNNRLD